MEAERSVEISASKVFLTPGSGAEATLPSSAAIAAWFSRAHRAISSGEARGASVSESIVSGAFVESRKPRKKASTE